ncbi:MAG: hypothetical protein V4850_23340 [Myxococcota bacterium]
MLVLLLALGCTGGDDTATPTDPSIVLVQPAEGSVVCGTPLDVVTEVVGIELVQPYEDPADALPGTGHVDVSLNGQDAAMGGEEALQIEGVEDGEYQLKVELSNADHTPVEPYAGDLVYITVLADACGAAR